MFFKIVFLVFISYVCHFLDLPGKISCHKFFVLLPLPQHFRLFHYRLLFLALPYGL